MIEPVEVPGARPQGYLLRLSLTAAAAFGLGAAEAQHLVLGPRSGHIVEAEINGTPLRLKVRLDHELAVNLNRKAAVGALLYGRTDSTMAIGPIKIRGRSADAVLTIAGRKTTRRIRWYERDAAPDADGTISADLLPVDSVTLETGAPVTLSRTVSFRTQVEPGHGIFVPIRAGGHNVAVRFAPHRPKTVALAAAAAAIGRDYGGRIEEARTMVEVAFGISRPARLLHLDRPLRIGEFTLPGLLTRTGDFRGGNRLPETEYSADESAIVVTGSSQSQNPVYRITIGSDVLGNCWAATYSAGSGSLSFRCTS